MFFTYRANRNRQDYVYVKEQYQGKQGKSEGFDSCDRPCNLKLGSNHRFFSPCDLGICWMTSKNNKTLLLYYVKLCATFQIHQCVKTGVKVRKRWIRVELLIFRPVWPWKLMYDLGKQYGTSSILHQVLCIISNRSVDSNLSYSPETSMDITSVIGNNSWKFQDDAMMET